MKKFMKKREKNCFWKLLLSLFHFWKSSDLLFFSSLLCYVRFFFRSRSSFENWDRKTIIDMKQKIWSGKPRYTAVYRPAVSSGISTFSLQLFIFRFTSRPGTCVIFLKYTHLYCFFSFFSSPNWKGLAVSGGTKIKKRVRPHQIILRKGNLPPDNFRRWYSSRFSLFLAVTAHPYLKITHIEKIKFRQKIY
jgi:hypothetical protein